MIPVSQPTLGPMERALVNECFERNQLTYGPMVKRFEAEFAEFLGIPHVLACSSGTTALHLALAALNIGPGDEVLVPDLTFVATANAVAYTGARVVLVDVDATTWCLDVDDAARKLTPATRAIVPVHLYGVPCDMQRICNFAIQYGLTVVEDAAEGLGGESDGLSLGCRGVAGIFSFYGNKVLTTGEGGAVCTWNDDLAERLYFLRGQALDPVRRYYHPEIGFNYRMTDLQGAVGCGQMSHLREMLAARHEILAHYHRRLCYISYASCVRPNAAPWIYTLLLRNPVTRDNLMVRLAERGIETRPTFVPLHRMPMYLGDDDSFPESCRIGDGGISLPTWPGLTTEQLDYICDEVIQCVTT